MAVPYMPLYVADYMAGTAHLTTVEHGAYILLIMTYWQRGEKLPNDDRKLARIAGLGPREWGRIRDTLSEFFEVDCSGWFHLRVETELRNLRAKSLKKRKGGLARAEQMHSNKGQVAKLIVDTEQEEEPLGKPKGAAPVQSDKQFWDGAKMFVGGINPGAMIGKWIKDHGKPETASAITAAQIERAVDPRGYITGVLRKTARNLQPAVGI